jgi:glycosyltransferase involved in cell wall biosynthesis
MKKIAFVYYPHYPSSTRLETMPFALNSVLSLAKMGWEVDLFVWEAPSETYKEILPSNVSVKYSVRVRYLWLYTRFRLQNSYYCVFGLGQVGAYIANLVAKANRCPLIYLNDEFPSHWGNNRWTSLEQQAAKDAAMIVVPDSQRFSPLSRELDISSKLYTALPNSPLTKSYSEKINWHQKLGLPKDSIPFLHAGAIADWAQVPELLSSVPYWPKQAVLILHSRLREVEKYRNELTHLDVPGKTFWSSEPMSESYLNSLVAYCAGNFALYRNTGSNIEYMGYSSGKLMRSLTYGCPVIASDLSSLAFIRDYCLGFLVSHPVEIPTAVIEIMMNREQYSQRCTQFYNENLSFENAWQIFCHKLKDEVGISLLI